MARKRTLNRKELRTDFDESENKPEDEEADETEEEEESEDEEEGDGEADIEADDEAADEEEAPKPVKKPKKKAAAPKRTRAAKVVRQKAIWVVYDNSSKEIQVFPYNQKADADAFLEQKNTDKKGAFYLQMKKVNLDETKEETPAKKGK